MAHLNYLAMTLPFAPFRDVYDQLNERRDVGKLISRGEAHVTVLTPPEFDLLKAHVSMAEINQIALDMKIQATELKPICLGEGRAVVEGVQQSTYFIVVQAEGLFKIRRAIADLYALRDKRAGLNPELVFHADHFYPHVTIGFTRLDLFEQQGVIKDDRSCVDALDTR